MSIISSPSRLIDWAEYRKPYQPYSQFPLAHSTIGNSQVYGLSLAPECPYRHLYFVNWAWCSNSSVYWNLGGVLRWLLRGQVVAQWNFGQTRTNALGAWSGVPAPALFNVFGLPTVAQHGFSPFSVSRVANSEPAYFNGAAPAPPAPDAIVLHQPGEKGTGSGDYRFITTIAPRRLRLVADRVEAVITHWYADTPVDLDEVAGEFYLACVSQAAAPA